MTWEQMTEIVAKAGKDAGRAERLVNDGAFRRRDVERLLCGFAFGPRARTMPMRAMPQAWRLRRAS